MENQSKTYYEFVIHISVVTPSIRPEGLKIIQESLAKQTFKNWEWLVEIGVPEQGYSLNRDYNKLLKRAKGELIVSWQDFLKAPPEALQKFWNAYQANPNTFFTAPVGKVLKWSDEPKYDWRINPESEMDWMKWEIDFGSAPLKCLQAIGGFDEWLDEKTWTFDAVNVGFRADLAGYKFKHLPENKAIALDHDKIMEHPWREKNYHPEFHNQRLDEFRRGLRIDYLN